ncbi:MAG: YHS domain-containing protein [Planctomycetes bacterium]|nr:YHS domain-containing protein [Planctomycetota bacterium]
MGGKIDRKLYADHQGKRVYFCCGGCDEKFKASPDKFLKQLAADGVALEDAPSAKPKAAAQGHNHGGSTQGSGCGGCRE